MAFGFANAAQSSPFGVSPSAGAASVQAGPDLEEIESESLGFLGLGAERKLRLLDTPWPADSLPPPTSCLLSIASKKGLAAAACPDGLVISSTDAIRGKLISSDTSSDNIIPFEPQLKVPLPMRISQVAFSADEEYLVISAETGGGLAVYDVQALMQGTTQPAAEIPTDGVSLRALVPNPTPERAELFAVVMTNGSLMIANLKERRFVPGDSGPVLKQGVSCVSWSAKGKQLVAGLGDGTAFQLTPSGEGKAVIPRPPKLDGDQHVSSISWLENDLFLVVHTPTTFDLDSSPTSVFHIVTRSAPSNYLFQAVGDPSPPFGVNRRATPHHYIQRLRDFKPSLTDMLIVSSTASTDVGLLTRSETPLTTALSAEKITKIFTTTTPVLDSRRPQLPMTEEMEDTSPIGVALDLSSKDPVPSPINDEVDKSRGPLPALFILNNDGILSAWWIVYSDSIRQGTTYAGLAAMAGAQRQSSPFANTSPARSSPFGQLSSAVSSPSAALLGNSASAAAPAFGAPGASGSAFGAATTLGRASPWGSQANASTAPGGGSVAFGKPSFGSSTALGATAQGSSFGAPSLPANRASPWGTPQGTQPATSSFGKPSLPGTSVFGGGVGSGAFGSATPAATPASGGGGFGSYANKGGFMTAASTTNTTGTFGSGSGAFGTPGQTPGVFGGGGKMDTDIDTSFPAPSTAKVDSKSANPFAGQPFKLGTTFQGDGTAKDDAPKPASTSGSSLFGANFGSALGSIQTKTQSPLSKEANMTSIDDGEIRQDSQPQGVILSASDPQHDQPATAPAVSPGVFRLDEQATPSVDPPAPLPPSPVIKREPLNDDGPIRIDKKIPEAPLPPDPTSKTSYAPDSSSSSMSASRALPDDAPLPPDFGPSKSVPEAEEDEEGQDADLAPSEENEENDEIEEKAAPPTLPEESSSGFEEESDSDPGEEEEEEDGSFEDVTHETVTEEQAPSIKGTPQSSFAGSVGGSFTQVSRPAASQTPRPLFGEIGSGSTPYLPPPHSKVNESPRSPSPVRVTTLSGAMRPDASRSVSAPGRGPTSVQGEAGLMRPPSSARSGFPRSQQGSSSTMELRTPVMAPTRAEPDDQDLSDMEDEKVKRELATEVEPTTKLGPFIAHQDYIGRINKAGVSGQIERLYRDINSMIDTLGLNARSLHAFIKGHTESYKDGGRGRADLEEGEEDDWCLIEIQDLGTVETEIHDQLDSGRVRDVKGKIEACRDIQKDLIKVRAKHNDIKRILDSRLDPVQLDAAQSAPLSSEQAMQQHDLRRSVTNLQKMLVDAEEGISLLKARLAAHDSASGRPGGRAVPTVEAVMNTIMKMTSMAEKKSGDIDVLENQMRKIRFTSSLPPSSNSPSREPSPFNTPLRSSRVSTLAGTPNRSSLLASTSSSKPGIGGGSLMGSPSSAQSTPRNRPTAAATAAAMTPEAIRRTTAKAAHRRVVAERLRKALIKAGPREQGAT
ncbi:MAG: hypothetical protein M1825_001755 [Sarcosagium campestre]|nr:MAG: hypothetical protein M1825_001755 [Sarcosagium campestre]